MSPCLKKSRAMIYSSMVEHSPNIHKTLGSISSTIKEESKTKKRTPVSTDIKEMGGKNLRSSDFPTRRILGEQMPGGGTTLCIRKKKPGISDGVPKAMGEMMGMRLEFQPRALAEKAEDRSGEPTGVANK